MLEFFNQMESLQKMFWFVALPTSAIFLIQTIMTFAGVDAADGVEADFDGDLNNGDIPFQLFSFRNLVNFLLGFGWSGVAFYQTIASQGLLILVSFIIGSLFVLLFFFLMKQIQGLAEDNTFKLREAVGLNAEVYLTIPANKSGKGKIQISIKGSIHELDAITTAETKIESGAMVKVIDTDQQLLIVQKI